MLPIIAAAAAGGYVLGRALEAGSKALFNHFYEVEEFDYEEGEESLPPKKRRTKPEAAPAKTSKAKTSKAKASAKAPAKSKPKPRRKAKLPELDQAVEAAQKPQRTKPVNPAPVAAPRPSTAAKKLSFAEQLQAKFPNGPEA